MNTPFTIEDELQATRTAIARVQEVIDSEPTEPPRRSLLTNLKSLEKRQRNLEAELLVKDTGISTEALEGYEQTGSELLQRLLSAKEELSCVQHDMDRLTKRGFMRRSQRKTGTKVRNGKVTRKNRIELSNHYSQVRQSETVIRNVSTALRQLPFEFTVLLFV